MFDLGFFIVFGWFVALMVVAIWYIRSFPDRRLQKTLSWKEKAQAQFPWAKRGALDPLVYDAYAKQRSRSKVFLAIIILTLVASQIYRHRNYQKWLEQMKPNLPADEQIPSPSP